MPGEESIDMENKVINLIISKGYTIGWSQDLSGSILEYSGGHPSTDNVNMCVTTKKSQ